MFGATERFSPLLLLLILVPSVCIGVAFRLQATLCLCHGLLGCLLKRLFPRLKGVALTIGARGLQLVLLSLQRLQSLAGNLGSFGSSLCLLPPLLLLRDASHVLADLEALIHSSLKTCPQRRAIQDDPNQEDKGLNTVGQREVVIVRVLQGKHPRLGGGREAFFVLFPISLAVALGVGMVAAFIPVGGFVLDQLDRHLWVLPIGAPGALFHLLHDFLAVRYQRLQSKDAGAHSVEQQIRRDHAGDSLFWRLVRAQVLRPFPLDFLHNLLDAKPLGPGPCEDVPNAVLDAALWEPRRPPQAKHCVVLPLNHVFAGLPRHDLTLCGPLRPSAAAAHGDRKLPEDLGPGHRVEVRPPHVRLKAPGPGLLQPEGRVEDSAVDDVLRLLYCPLCVALLHVRQGEADERDVGLCEQPRAGALHDC
mmetsp:Transcript_9727/g.23360  ORF Transcript_9727/g.23360 Transcript_9727/m.23360 type:complete len:419 (+) Transcript_9727:1950-3206(+)